jgi:hypothetical protein
LESSSPEELEPELEPELNERKVRGSTLISPFSHYLELPEEDEEEPEAAEDDADVDARLGGMVAVRKFGMLLR